MYLACQLYYRYLSDNENSLNVSYCTLLCLLLVIQNCVKCTLLLSCDGRKFLYESWGKYTSTALVQVVVTVLYTTSIKYVRIILQHDSLMYRDMYYIPSMYSSVNHVTRRVQDGGHATKLTICQHPNTLLYSMMNPSFRHTMTMVCMDHSRSNQNLKDLEGW